MLEWLFSKHWSFWNCQILYWHRVYCMAAQALIKSRHTGYSQWPGAITRSSIRTKCTLLHPWHEPLQRQITHRAWAVSFICSYILDVCSCVFNIISIYINAQADQEINQESVCRQAACNFISWFSFWCVFSFLYSQIKEHSHQYTQNP